MLRPPGAAGVLTALGVAGVSGERGLQQIVELRYGEAGPDNQTAHRVPVDGVVTGDDQI